MELTGALFKPKLEKIKKKRPEKKSYISGNGTFRLQRKEISYIFSKESLPYISGNGKGTFLYFRKLLTFQEVTLRAQKKKKHPPLKNSLYFGKYNFLATSLKNFLYFRRNFQSLKKTSKKSALKKFLVSYVFTIFKAVKHRKIPCEAKIQHIFYGSRWWLGQERFDIRWKLILWRFSSPSGVW